MPQVDCSTVDCPSCCIPHPLDASHLAAKYYLTMHLMQVVLGLQQLGSHHGMTQLHSFTLRTVTTLDHLRKG